MIRAIYWLTPIALPGHLPYLIYSKALGSTTNYLFLFRFAVSSLVIMGKHAVKSEIHTVGIRLPGTYRVKITAQNPSCLQEAWGPWGLILSTEAAFTRTFTFWCVGHPRHCVYPMVYSYHSSENVIWKCNQRRSQSRILFSGLLLHIHRFKFQNFQGKDLFSESHIYISKLPCPFHIASIVNILCPKGSD